MSHVPATFTRTQFEEACISFAQESSQNTSQNERLDAVRRGWIWVPHQLSGYGYLKRKRKLFSKIEAINENLLVTEEEEEAATSPVVLPPFSTLTEYVVYSATYQVPGFCFTFHDSLGVPISPISAPELAGIHPELLEDLHTTNFPGLSQQDHPVLSTPCWYLHPCETSKTVVQLLKERFKTLERKNAAENITYFDWLDTWLLVVCGAIRLDTGLVEC